MKYTDANNLREFNSLGRAVEFLIEEKVDQWNGGRLEQMAQRQEAAIEMLCKIIDALPAESREKIADTLDLCQVTK